jgi:hypothetical protein
VKPPQPERAIRFARNRRFALDIKKRVQARAMKLLDKYGFEVEGTDVFEKMIALSSQT